MVYVDHDALYHKVQIKIERIPPHVFEASTAAAILRPYCSMIRVHPQMVARLDLAVFKLTAWTTRPKRIPESRTIAIPEPEDHMLPLPMCRTLRYTVHIHVRRLIMRVPPDSPPPSPPPTPSSTQSSSDDDSPNVAPRRSRSHVHRHAARQSPAVEGSTRTVASPAVGTMQHTHQRLLAGPTAGFDIDGASSSCPVTGHETIGDDAASIHCQPLAPQPTAPRSLDPMLFELSFVGSAPTDTALVGPPTSLDASPLAVAYYGFRAEGYVDPMIEEASCFLTAAPAPTASRTSIPVSIAFGWILATLDLAGITSPSMELVRFPVAESNSKQLITSIISETPTPPSDVINSTGFVNTERGSQSTGMVDGFIPSSLFDFYKTLKAPLPPSRLLRASMSSCSRRRSIPTTSL